MTDNWPVIKRAMVGPISLWRHSVQLTSGMLLAHVSVLHFLLVALFANTDVASMTTVVDCFAPKSVNKGLNSNLKTEIELI